MLEIEHTCTLIFNKSASDLFPLFNPEEEKKWAPGWDYEDVMDNKIFKEDYVFLTNCHDHKTTTAIWIIKKYDPSNFLIQYYKIEPENKVGIITVKCQPIGKHETTVNVTYKYIAVSKSGEEFIKSFTFSEYEKYINEWKYLIDKYYEYISNNHNKEMNEMV